MKWQFNLHMIRNIITLLVRIRTKWLVSLEVSVGTKTVAYPALRRRWLPLAYHVTKTEHHGRLAALWPTLYIEIHIDTFCLFVSTLDTVTMTSAFLIGHSFIRRTRDFLIVPPHGKKGRDISESRQHVASIAADKAELAEMVAGLFTASQNINLVCDLWKAESTVVAIRPEIVLLQVGSNDLAHIVQDDESAVAAIATSVVDFAKRLLDHFGVRFVIINSMVPRNSNNMSCSADVFLKNMTLFNRKVRHLSEAVQGLSYNHLRGFYRRKIQNKDEALPISCWSHDGIHCNAAYQAKYLQRLRFAILLAATKLGCHPPCPVSHVSV